MDLCMVIVGYGIVSKVECEIVVHCWNVCR